MLKEGRDFPKKKSSHIGNLSIVLLIIKCLYSKAFPKDGNHFKLKKQYIECGINY